MAPTTSPARPTVTHKEFDDLAVGDRVETWDGTRGTVTRVEFDVPTRCHDGSLVAFGATIDIHSTHLRTFDSWGWPKYYEGTVTRNVRKYSSDLRLHCTIPAAVAVAKP